MRRRTIQLIVFIAALLLVSSATARAQSNADCMGCHDDATLFKKAGDKQISMNVDPAKFKKSVHADLDCVDCHKGVKDEDPHEPLPKAVTCTSCHEDEVHAFSMGRHASAPKRGDDRAATCISCHGPAHEMLSKDDPDSKVSRKNIPQTCGECHGQKFALAKSGLSTRPFVSYQESVHGKAVARGKKAAVCTDCHDSHDLRGQDDPKSKIFKKNVAKTCGECHEKVAKKYDVSTHGKAVNRGNFESPTCTDCHGIHAIKKHDDPTSPVAKLGLSRTCGKCHEGVRLSQEFGVKGDRSKTYGESYHGMASKLGSGVVANCASCHGVHDILPSDDPKSMIYKDNLVKTCGECHPGASENFIKGKIHLDSKDAALVPLAQVGKSTGNQDNDTDTGAEVIEWIRWTYVLLIIATIGGMLFHNYLNWRRHLIEYLKKTPRNVERLTPSHRFQHAVLVISFMTLVVTGFALKYPDSIVALALGSSETIRRYGHRVAAIALCAIAAYHVLYLILTPQGRKDLVDMWPRWKDVTDVLGCMKYWLTGKGEKPKMARFTYAEKAEYWALMWGTVVMAITGFMLWYPVELLFGVLPRWSIDAATVVHFYEAILATAAIFVWHFYQVMFSPEAQPINLAFLDGRMSDEQFKHEHALTWEEMQANGKAKSIREEAANPAAAETPTPTASELKV